MSDSRELGEQPLIELMVKHNLSANNLVKASEVPMTHKMVKRACKGRRLTGNTMRIVRNALNLASGEKYTLSDLFNYRA
ncbi:MAG: hypothetical protein QGF46_02610 [Planctomycetota bacterium]|jgi:hypothetical protein|nr:hypothetical protein [Planctomycetota bacterium]